MKVSETVAIKDRIIATGETAEEILEGFVTGVDDDTETVFFTTLDGDEVVISAFQITDNFGPDSE